MKRKRCSNCGEDLTKIETEEDYRLTLTSTYLFGGNIINDEPDYFCGLGCLRNWMNNQLGDHDDNLGDPIQSIDGGNLTL